MLKLDVVDFSKVVICFESLRFWFKKVINVYFLFFIFYLFFMFFRTKEKEKEIFWLIIYEVNLKKKKNPIICGFLCRFFIVI